MKRLARHFGITLGLAVLAGALFTGSASAASGNAVLGISPLGQDGQFFNLTMEPGEQRMLSVEIGNYGEADATGYTYAADAYTIINGGFGARLAGEPVSGTTLWLTYPSDTITLAPDEALHREFSITVPADAAAGEYITSLVVQSEDNEAMDNGSGVALKQVLRKVIAVAITIPGPRVSSLEIGAASHKATATASSISFELHNAGNVLVKPNAEFVLYNENDREVSRYVAQLDSIYAKNSTHIEVPFDTVLHPGEYTATLDVTFEGQTISSGRVPLVVTEQEAIVSAEGEGSRRARVEQDGIIGVSGGGWVTGAGALVGAATLFGLLGFVTRKGWKGRLSRKWGQAETRITDILMFSPGRLRGQHWSGRVDPIHGDGSAYMVQPGFSTPPRSAPPAPLPTRRSLGA